MTSQKVTITITLDDATVRQLERSPHSTDHNVWAFFDIEGPKLWHEIREQLGCPHYDATRPSVPTNESGGQA